MEQGKSRKTGAIAAVLVLVAVVIAAFAAYTVIGTMGKDAAKQGVGSGSAVAASSSSGASASSTGTSGTSTSTSAAGASGTWNQPKIAALSVEDADGNETTLGEVCDGRITVINTWATWCPYCVDEMHDFQDLYDKYGDDIQFVMLNIADSSQEIAEAPKYIADEGFTFPVFYDKAHEVCRYFGVRAYPTTIVINADGEVLANGAGRVDTDALDEALGGLL